MWDSFNAANTTPLFQQTLRLHFHLQVSQETIKKNIYLRTEFVWKSTVSSQEAEVAS